MIYLQLFWEFFKTGLFAVGGGMATIPFLYDLSDKTGWFTHNDLANMIAVGESTPGPIGVNMATYVGFLTGMRESGILTAILGAVTATLGLITPSVIVILIIAAILKRLLRPAPCFYRPDHSCRYHRHYVHFGGHWRRYRAYLCIELEGSHFGRGVVGSDQCGEAN